jgi:flagellar assembly protein FliH
LRSAFTADIGAVPARGAATAAPSGSVTSAVFARADVRGSSSGMLDGDRDRARTAGYAAGYAAGAAEAARAATVEAQRVTAQRAAEDAHRAEQLDAALAVLARAAHAAAARTAPVLAQAEQAVHAAALELTSAVLAHELADGEHAARAALGRVLDHPQLPGIQTVRLNPRDLAALQAAGGSTRTAGVELVADPSLAPGDAIGEHADGYLDARIGEALDRARAALATDPRTDALSSGLPNQRGRLS